MSLLNKWRYLCYWIQESKGKLYDLLWKNKGNKLKFSCNIILIKQVEKVGGIEEIRGSKNGNWRGI